MDENYDSIYNILKNLPLYKQRGKEECFLGILKSKEPKWIGWQYIRCIKKQKTFDDPETFLELYKLAINFYILKNTKISKKNLLKNYEF